MKYITRIPELKALSCRLIYICLAAILVYAVFAALNAASISPFTAADIFHTILTSTVISLGGGLLLDLEIRHFENKN